MTDAPLGREREWRDRKVGEKKMIRGWEKGGENANGPACPAALDKLMPVSVARGPRGDVVT